MPDDFDFGAWRMGKDGQAHHYVGGKALCGNRGSGDTGADVAVSDQGFRKCNMDCTDCLEAVERRWVDMY